MEPFNLILGRLGGFVFLLSLASAWLEKVPFPATLASLFIGIALGPAVLDVIDVSALQTQPRLMENLGRVTLAISLAGVALRIPRRFIVRKWRQMSLLVALSMPMIWIIGTGLIYAILDQDILHAALIAAIVTPTDPVASGTVVSGAPGRAHIPDSLRHSISLESGVNDVLAYPFVLLPLMLLTGRDADVWTTWLTKTWLFEVGLAVVLGLALGYVAAKMLLFAQRKNTISENWRCTYVLSLALFAAGGGALAGVNEILLVFLSSAMFSQIVGDEASDAHGSMIDAVDRFFSIPIFAVIGMLIPWDGWRMLGWDGALLMAALLLFRRMPVLLLLRPLLGNVRSVKDALLMGWFGPVAVAALYYIGLVGQRLEDPRIWHVTSLIICASAVIHGASGAPLTAWYGRLRKTTER